MIVGLALKGGKGGRGGGDFEGATLIYIRDLGLTGRKTLCPTSFVQESPRSGSIREVSVVFSFCLMENKQKRSLSGCTLLLICLSVDLQSHKQK